MIKRRFAEALFFMFVLSPFSLSASANNTLIEGDGFSLSEEELNNRLTVLPVMERLRVGANEDILRQFINQQYRIEALYAGALKSGIADSEDVQEKIQIMIKQITIKAYLNKLQDSVEIPDLTALAELRYAAEREKYSVGDELEARHLLLKTGNTENNEKLKERIQGYKNRIEQGEDFAELAKLYSEDAGSAKAGGELKRFGRGQMVPEFEAAVFELSEPGALSDIVQTKYGYHLIQLIAKYPGRQKSFDEVKPSIIAQLQREYLQEEMDRLRAEIVDPAKAKIHKEALQLYVEKTTKETQAEAAQAAESYGRSGK
jgi:peptidyl-prolyl cis-trans isomerase C